MNYDGEWSDSKGGAYGVSVRTPWGTWPGYCDDNFFCGYTWLEKQATEDNVTRSEVVVNECRQLRLGESSHFLSFHRSPFEQQ